MDHRPRRPSALDIATNIGCSCGCVYCPQPVLTRAYAKGGGDPMMSLEVFERCVEKLPGDIRLMFAGVSEPWLNPECTRMIEWAHTNGRQVKVFTTTTGMTAEDVRRVTALPGIEMVLHVPSAEGLEDIVVDSGYLSRLDDLLDSGVVSHCHCHGLEVHPMVADLLSGGGNCGSPATSRVPVETYPPAARAGNVDVAGVADVRKGGRLSCLRTWENLLLPNGDVLICSLDYGMRHVIGNLLLQDYDSLFASVEYLRVQRGLEDPRLDVLCRSCECAANGTLLARTGRWFRRELREAETPADLLGIAVRSVREGVRYLRS